MDNHKEFEDMELYTKEQRKAYMFGIIMLGIIFLTLVILAVMLIRLSFYGGLSVSMLIVGVAFLLASVFVLRKMLPWIRSLIESFRG